MLFMGMIPSFRTDELGPRWRNGNGDTQDLVLEMVKEFLQAMGWDAAGGPLGIWYSPEI